MKKKQIAALGNPKVVFYPSSHQTGGIDTISLVVTAAETSHLVLATLHTTSAMKTIDRIVNVFPPGRQTQIRMQPGS